MHAHTVKPSHCEAEVYGRPVAGPGQFAGFGKKLLMQVCRSGNGVCLGGFLLYCMIIEYRMVDTSKKSKIYRISIRIQGFLMATNMHALIAVKKRYDWLLEAPGSTKSLRHEHHFQTWVLRV